MLILPVIVALKTCNLSTRALNWFKEQKQKTETNAILTETEPVDRLMTLFYHSIEYLKFAVNQSWIQAIETLTHLTSALSAVNSS